MNEMEIIQHDRIPGLTIFFNTVDYRTPHFHSEWELIWLLDSPLLVSFGGNVFQAEAGSFLLFAPGQPHEFRHVGRACTFLCMQVSREMLPLEQEQIPVNPYLGIGKQEWKSIIKEIAGSYFQSNPYRSLCCQGNTLLLFYSIFSSISMRKLSREERQQSDKRNRRLAKLIHYVDENYMHKITLSEFAEREGFSMSYLSHFVKETMNQSFQEYVTSVRVNAASKLMSTTNQRLIDISVEAGFSDYRYFSNAFKKQFGMTPEQYRMTSVHPESVFTHHSIHSLERFYSDEESCLLLLRI